LTNVRARAVAATCWLPLALASLDPRISQAEGRGFDPRRPLSSLDTDLLDFARQEGSPLADAALTRKIYPCVFWNP
jgi:hypothetical protein